MSGSRLTDAEALATRGRSGEAVLRARASVLLRQLGKLADADNMRLAMQTIDIVDQHARIDVARRTWV